jgi:hypothetical protein
MKMLPVFVSALALITGCATSYQPRGLSGGYSETQLGENIFQVSFHGNGYTSRERASDFALLRSADVTIENGFRYFVVVDSGKSSTNSTYTAPTTSSTSGTVYASGNSAYGTATTTTSGGQTYRITKPGATDTIICYKDKPDIQGLIFDAEFVVKSLKQKYGIDQ